MNDQPIQFPDLGPFSQIEAALILLLLTAVASCSFATLLLLYLMGTTFRRMLYDSTAILRGVRSDIAMIRWALAPEAEDESEDELDVDAALKRTNIANVPDVEVGFSTAAGRSGHAQETTRPVFASSGSVGAEG